MAKHAIAVAIVEILIPENGKINHRLSIFVNPVTIIAAKADMTAAKIKTGLTISLRFCFSSFKIKGQPPSFQM